VCNVLAFVAMLRWRPAVDRQLFVPESQCRWCRHVVSSYLFVPGPGAN